MEAANSPAVCPLNQLVANCVNSGNQFFCFVIGLQGYWLITVHLANIDSNNVRSTVNAASKIDTVYLSLSLSYYQLIDHNMIYLTLFQLVTMATQ